MDGLVHITYVKGANTYPVCTLQVDTMMKDLDAVNLGESARTEVGRIIIAEIEAVIRKVNG